MIFSSYNYPHIWAISLNISMQETGNILLPVS